MKSKIYYIAEGKPVSGPGKHYIFGGSGAKQYIACGQSVWMRQKYPETGSSPAASEGTRLHALMEHCLKSGEVDASGYVGVRMEDEATDVPVLTKEQCDAVSVVLEHVWELTAEPGAELYVEQQLTMPDIDPEAGGTGDIFVRVGDTGHVIDAKFGKGVTVEAYDNDQMQHYSAGWRRKFGDAMPFRLVLTIIQPRMPHADGPVRSWETDLLALMEWEGKLSAAITNARDPNCKAVAGEHCQFCPGTQLAEGVDYRCAAYGALQKVARDAAFDTMADMTQLQKMSAAELGRRYSELSLLRKYIKDMESLVKMRARSELPEGFEWAKGSRSWKWKGSDGYIFDIVRLLHGDVEARELVKIITPIQAKEALGPAVFADVADFIDKGEAAPQLVKKGARKTPLSLPEVQAWFARNSDAAFDEVE